MPDFYADYPFPEVILKIPNAEKFCSIGDVVSGMKSGTGRVEKFVDGGVLVHPTMGEVFCARDTIVSPTGTAEIVEISNA